MKKMFAFLGAAMMLASPGIASAHTAWFVRDGQANSWTLRFGGHGGELETADPAKLKEVRTYDGQGRDIPFDQQVRGTDIRITTEQEPAVIALYYDNGIHTQTNTPGPSIEKPMTEVPDAASAVSAIKYGKAIVNWTPTVTRRAGQRFEVVPLSATQPRAGQPMRVRVLQDGEPVSGVNIGRGEDTAEATTDDNGVARFTPSAGYNKLWAGRRIPRPDNPRFTELSYEYLLTFHAR